MSQDSNRCALTDSEDVIDDCYIEIQFGYGSPRDLETYNFGPVKHEMGETVLHFIASYMAEGKSLEDFKKKWQKPPAEHNPDWDLHNDEQQKRLDKFNKDNPVDNLQDLM